MLSPYAKKQFFLPTARAQQPGTSGAGHGHTAGKSPGEPPKLSYGLLHTIGATEINEKGGDGAYSAWMQSFFEAESSSTGAVAIARIEREGPFTEGNEASQNNFETNFLKKLTEEITSERFQNTSVFIFNFHLRFTGRPNSYTGRGIRNVLLDKVRGKFKDLNKDVKIVYTIHEPEGLQQKLEAPSAVVSLNSEVFDRVRRQFPTAEHLKSRVPGLMINRRAAILDDVNHFLRNESFIDEPQDKKNFFLAQLQTQARQRGVLPGNEHLPSKAIVIFGSITTRHGLTRHNVKRLAKEMNEETLDPELKIVIAGGESDRQLAKSLKHFKSKKVRERVHYVGPIEDLDNLSKYRYAISFDKKGYRSNASAIINLDRNGFLVYSRLGDESDKALIKRTVASIKRSEGSSRHYVDELAKNQPRTRSADPKAVGTELGEFFARIANR